MNAKNRNILRYFSIILTILLAFTFMSCDVKETDQTISENEVNIQDFEKVYVKWVVDGDTIKTEDGRTIRIIGINSPENGKFKEIYGKESTRFAIDTLKNKEVYLEKDVSDLDQYGRPLRYVWIEIPNKIDKENIEKYNFSVLSISKGYSAPYIFEPDRKYENYIIDLAIIARDEGLGLWQFGKEGTTRMTEF